MTFRFPSIEQRISVIGRTGSGKSTFGAYVLAVAPFHLQPYIIVDYKGERIFRGVDRIRPLELGDKIPTRPGVYIIQPRPEIDDEAVTKFLYGVWDQENTGLFFDEAYMVPQRTGPFNGILTQGRSLHIPAIVLTQRPAWISQFVFSEADFFAVFHLNTRADKQRVYEYTGMDVEQPLADYHCRYFDVSRSQLTVLQPVPDAATIQQMLHDRLKPEKSRFR